MSSENLGSYWRNAGELMGFKVEAPYELPLSNGVTIEAAALLPDFGAKRGMLLVDRFDDIGVHWQEIVANGYGFSVLGSDDGYDPSQVDYESIMGCLKDWEWASKEPRPDWLK